MIIAQLEEDGNERSEGLARAGSFTASEPGRAQETGRPALAASRRSIEVMPALARGFVEMGCVRLGPCGSVINGPVGQTRQDLRS